MQMLNESVFAIIFRLLWFIIIVFIGNYINRSCLELKNMQSQNTYNLLQVDVPDAPIKTAKKKTRRKKTNLNSPDCKLETHSTEEFLDEDSIEKFIVSIHHKSLDINNYHLRKVDLHEKVTKIFDVKAKMANYFVVNEDVFLDQDGGRIMDEEYHGYQLYKVLKTPEQSVSDDDLELTEEELTEDLFVTEEKIKQGLIINANIFVTLEQWHTIRELAEDIFSCTVCQFQCDAASLPAHMQSSAHARNLDGHRPLKRFDLSITRKINENLHCAVCNELYPIKSYRIHENSKSHEGKLLSAINKVSDLIETGPSPSTFSFNANNIQAPNNAPILHRQHQSVMSTPPTLIQNQTEMSGHETYSSRIEANSARSDADLASNGASSTRYNTNITGAGANETYGSGIESNSARYDADLASNGAMSTRFDANSIGAIYKRNEKMTRMNTNLGNATNNGTHTARNEQSESNQDGSQSDLHIHRFKDVKIYEDDEIEEYIPPIEGVSYANMASKPRVNVPKFLKIDLGTKEFRVQYDSWHMIKQLYSNQLYCMVCNVTVAARHRTQHCTGETHAQVLARCAVVAAFGNYLIRDVNDRLYHCGHCNNLQVKNDIQAHIEKYHPLKNSNIQDVNPLLIFSEPTNEQSIPTRQLDIFGDFKFSPFGTELVVSNLGCHTLMRKDNGFYCALCNTDVSEDLLKHVFETAHVQYIAMTPFIKPFLSNLTRAIRGSLHCALCNELVPVSAIYQHNLAPSHTAALARALGMRRAEKPTHEVKYRMEDRIDFKTELERFLSTLPPECRGALSKLQIKNHKGELLQLSDAESSLSYSPTLSVNNSPHKVPLNPANGYPSTAKDGSYPTDCTKTNDTTRPVMGYPSSKADVSGKDGCYPVIMPGQLFPRQMLTVSMIESGIPGLRTGSPVTGLGRPVQLQITGPVDFNNGVGRIPVSPVRRPESAESANVLMSLFSQSPARMPNVPEAKVEVAKRTGVDVQGGKVEKKLEGKSEKVQENGDVKRAKAEMLGNESAGRIDKKDLKTAERTKAGGRRQQQHQRDAAPGHAAPAAPHGALPQPGSDKGKRKDSLRCQEADLEQPFKLDDIVLLKLKSTYFKVTNTAYQTLVHQGNGTRYCFVCSQNLEYGDLQHHVVTPEHVDSMSKNKFVCTYNGQLLRQMYLMYHCAICNVLLSRNEIKLHLKWRVHGEKYDLACEQMPKKLLKETLRKGTKEFVVDTKKESVDLSSNTPEPHATFVTYVQTHDDNFEEIVEERKLVRKYQMVALNGSMLRITFESWHGIAVTKNVTKCIICQVELLEGDVERHLGSRHHTRALEVPFEKKYYPALARKVNENTVNCVICNLELPNEEALVREHIGGRKHLKNSADVKNTAQGESYGDCYRSPITL